MKESPFVSVIMPTYNNYEVLEIAMRAVINQIYPKDKYELIIVDDGSSDKTRELIRHYIKEEDTKIRYIFQKDKGFRAAKARNEGVRFSKGKIIIFLDQDVVAKSDLIKNHVKALEDADCVYGYVSRQGERNRTAYGKKYFKKLNQKQIDLIYPEGDNRPNFCNIKQKELWKFCFTNNLSIKKEIFEKNEFIESFNRWGFEDIEFAFKLHKKGYRLKAENRCIAHHIWHSPVDITKFTRAKENAIKMFQINTYREVEEYIRELYENRPKKNNYLIIRTIFEIRSAISKIKFKKDKISGYRYLVEILLNIENLMKDCLRILPEKMQCEMQKFKETFSINRKHIKRKYLREVHKQNKKMQKRAKKRYEKVKEKINIIYELLINKNVGRIGIILKKRFPKIYRFLKNEKKKHLSDTGR